MTGGIAGLTVGTLCQIDSFHIHYLARLRPGFHKALQSQCSTIANTAKESILLESCDSLALVLRRSAMDCAGSVPISQVCGLRCYMETRLECHHNGLTMVALTMSTMSAATPTSQRSPSSFPATPCPFTRYPFLLLPAPSSDHVTFSTQIAYSPCPSKALVVLQPD